MKLTLVFLFIAHISSAQIFTEVTDAPFEGVRLSTHAFSDVDNDGDLDVLLTGRLNGDPAIKTADLYYNDGFGKFTKKDDPDLEGVTFGSISFGDIDNDGDQDLLITGSNISNDYVANLYINDGLGNFKDKNNTPFIGVRSSSAEFADVDNDGDLDVLICGQNSAGSGETRLYTNNGLGDFEENLNTSFIWMADGDISFGDVDGDDDLDLIITGLHSPASNARTIAELYINDGNGTFSLANESPFKPLISGTVSLADINGDGDLDVLLTGSSNAENPPVNMSILYTNNGNGEFTEVKDTPFEGVVLSSADFADIDGDDDLDVLITGKNNSPVSSENYSAKLYINDGSGTFTEELNTAFEDVAFGSVSFADVDGDEDPDVLITGWRKGAPSTSIAKLYLNQFVTSADKVEVQESMLQVFPNPSIAGSITVNYFADNGSPIRVSLIDINGHVINQLSTDSYPGENVIAMNVSTYSKGKYIIKLDNGQKSIFRKIIIQ